MVARLVPVGQEPPAVTDGGRPAEVPPARGGHAARHARPADDQAAPPASYLSIRSAERRRCSADLTSPDITGVVLHGPGGIGKSALAAQIASRLGRLAPAQEGRPQPERR